MTINKHYSYTHYIFHPGQHIHFIGVGGTGMSGLAHYLATGGARISGSDAQITPATYDYLKSSKVRIFRAHSDGNVTHRCSLVVKSAAIPDTNPEIVQAKRYCIPIVKYADLLGELMGQRETGIAISGTHGKTTTSSLMAYLLHRARLEPSFVIGGVPKDFQSNANCGRGSYFVAEACEYDRSFHKLPARFRVITNIEPDHMDYYGNVSNLVEAFRVFCRMTRPDGLVIANIDSPLVRKCVRGLRVPITTFGTTQKADWYFKTSGNSGKMIVYHRGKRYGEFKLGIPGRHNFYNALAAIIVADTIGISKPVISRALAEFRGVSRRFDIVADGAKKPYRIIIDDYGHHPTELTSTLKTARSVYPNRRLFCVFQPHQYSRTRRFLNDFARVLTLADVVLIPPIFSARDSRAEQQLISSITLVDRINALAPKAKYFPDFSGIVKYLHQNTIPGDVIITMGAGDVWKVGYNFTLAV